jgi:hypothetical protein
MRKRDSNGETGGDRQRKAETDGGDRWKQKEQVG